MQERMTEEKRKEIERAYRREYYQRNRERCLAKSKEYYEKNREARKEYRRRYHREHPEKARESMKKWIEKNREKWREYNREYQRKRRAEKKAKEAQAHDAGGSDSQNS